MPDGRVLIALSADKLVWEPSWTRVDDYAESLVSGFDIGRGKQTEEDQTDTSIATVYLNDTQGLFDPGNVGSDFAGYLGKQILLQVRDPVASAWVQQTRMWIDHVDFDINPNTRDGKSILSNVQLGCIDIFGLLSRLRMDVSEVAGNRVFGNEPPADRQGIILYEDSNPDIDPGFDNRLIQIADDCGMPEGSPWCVFFTGNVDLLEGVYDVGDSPMMAIQQTVDAEMPGAGNAYSDKQGRLCAHGRGARFDPDGVSASAGDAQWNFRRFKAGDGEAITLDPDRAQIRPPLGWSYSEEKIRNVGYAYPKDLAEEDKPGQVFVVPGVDPIDRRVWSAENLLVKAGTTTGNTGAEEARAYAEFWATVLADPIVRVEALTLKSIPVGHPQAAATWDLMLGGDISDIIDLEHGYAGDGVGISDEYFIEGSEMTVRALNPEMDMVTVTFNVSPTAYYADAEMMELLGIEAGGEGGGGGGSGGGDALLYEDWSEGIESPWAFEGDETSLDTAPSLLVLRVGPGSPGPNPGSFLASAYLDGGYTGGSPGEAFAEAGMDTWYRVPVRFPSGYQATAGEFNWVVEWHVASGTPGPFSCGMGVYSDGPIVDENDDPGTDPRLFFVVRYGSTGDIQEERHTMSTNIPLDTWMVMEFYFEWRTDPTVGKFEWYIDGDLEWSIDTVPTMLDDGLANGWGMYNYHRLSNFENSIEFGAVSIAADRADL